MKALLDTSTLIAGMLPDHVHYPQASPWLLQAKSGAFDLFCSAHSLAELYAVLTRLPRTPPISPGDAWRLIQENVIAHATVQSLPAVEYATLIRELAEQGMIGALVYDAVISRVAELAAVDLLVTLNNAHFQRVWPAGASRIASPLTHSPP